MGKFSKLLLTSTLLLVYLSTYLIELFARDEFIYSGISCLTLEEAATFLLAS